MALNCELEETFSRLRNASSHALKAFSPGDRQCLDDGPDIGNHTLPQDLEWSVLRVTYGFEMVESENQ